MRAPDRGHVRLLLVLAAIAAAAAASVAPRLSAAGPDAFAIVGATLLDGTGGPPLPDAIVVVEGERIKAVGARAQVPLAKGLRIVDGRGRWVVPGLVDAHVHFFQ